MRYLILQVPEPGEPSPPDDDDAMLVEFEGRTVRCRATEVAPEPHPLTFVLPPEARWNP